MPSGTMSDYAVMLGQAECLRLLQERLNFVYPGNWPNPEFRSQPGYLLDDETGCWLWNGRVLPEGYAQIKRKSLAQRQSGDGDRNTGTNFLFHRIAYTSYHGVDCHLGASHLCGNPRCFKPDHIVDEDILANNRRKGCPGDVFCPDHGHLIVALCHHQPRCIKRPQPGVVCCLSRRRVPTISSPVLRQSSPPAPDPASNQSSFDVVQPSSQADVQLELPRLQAIPSSSSPIRGPVRRRRDSLATRLLAVDPSSLPGSEMLAPNSMDNSDGLEDFVVDDDCVEFETQVTDDWSSDF